MTRQLANSLGYTEIIMPARFWMPFYGYVTLPQWASIKKYFISPKGHCLSEKKFIKKATKKVEKRKLNNRIENPYSYGN